MPVSIEIVMSRHAFVVTQSYLRQWCDYSNANGRTYPLPKRRSGWGSRLCFDLVRGIVDKLNSFTGCRVRAAKGPSQ